MLPEVADVTDNSTLGEFIGIRWNSCTFRDLSALPVDALDLTGPPQKTNQMLESDPLLQIYGYKLHFGSLGPSQTRNHRFQSKFNCNERTYWYMLHFGYIRRLTENTDFSNNPTAMSAFTGIRCTWATRGRSPKLQSSTTTTQLPRVDLLVYAALGLYY